MKNNELVVKGLSIAYREIEKEKFICLTDIARMKNPIAPADVVKN